MIFLHWQISINLHLENKALRAHLQKRIIDIWRFLSALQSPHLSLEEIKLHPIRLGSVHTSFIPHAVLLHLHQGVNVLSLNVSPRC